MSATTASIVREINIGPDVPKFTLPQDTEPDGPSAMVVAGSIVALGAEVTGQHRQDVLQSLLLAQLAANAKASRQDDPSKWFAAYRAVLEQVAWVVEASVGAIRYQPPFGKFTIDTVVDDVFRQKLLEEQFALMSAAVAAGRTEVNRGAQSVFDAASHAGGLGNFQVAVVNEDDGPVTIRLAQIVFDTQQYIGSLLQDTFTNQAQFRVGYLVLSMNEAVFSKFRSAINTKLAGRLDRAAVMLQLS